MATVLVIHAHPDDEVFATAGWIAAAAAAGERVVNVIATGGEASELRRGLDYLATARRRRVRKFERSLEMLGSANWEWLAEPGRWIDGDPRRYPTLAEENVDVLAGLVGECILRHSPDVILSVGVDGMTAHPDHVQIARAVSAAVRQTGRPRGGAWGARVRAGDVGAAHAYLHTVAGLDFVGSGRVVGTSDPLHRRPLDVSAASRRRDALDCYQPGLGTMTIEELASTYSGRGDSLLLRGLFDATKWAAEYYSDLGSVA
jgi:LmbE family N-acetylglucosaminyl deacetylase